jgi:hypothetical protein
MRQIIVCSIELGSLFPESTCNTEIIPPPDEPMEDPIIMADRRITIKRHVTQIRRDMIDGVFSVTRLF